MAQRAFSTHPLVVRRVQVRRVTDVTPRMRRVTIGGEQLAAFDRGAWRHPAFAAPGFDDHVKLIFASDGDVTAALPEQVEHGIEWGPSQTREGRDYTPRAVRVDDDGAVEVDLDFVLHGDGPAASWAMRAAVGDDLWFVGPKSSTILPDDVSRIVLVGDETALPAIGRFLDERPIEVPATIAVMIGDPSARQQLAVRAEDTLEWIEADATDAGALDDIVRRACGDDGTGLYAWLAGESRALLPARRFLSRELGLPKAHINVTGYWHAEPQTVADGGAASDAELPPVVSPLVWLTVRAALQTGIVDAVADAPGLSATDVAARCALARRDLDLLLGTLVTHGVLRGDPAELHLGALGEELIADEHEREEYDGLEADRLLALASFAPAVRTGTSPWAEYHGTTLDDWARSDPARYDELVHEAGALAYLLDGLMADPVWDAARSVRLTGPGAVLVADALTASERNPRVDIWESATALAALRSEADDLTEISWIERDSGAGASVDLAVAARALAHRTDTEASVLLAELAGVTRVAVVIEDSRPDGLNPHADEEALHVFAATGSPPRDADAIGALAGAAGWRVSRVVPLGWGVEATVLER
ncbi:siderophore-interacting protein [Microbacterium sp. NPDC055910]|uniref:siderophore-interacting protein n=1 Tax=Microbacterium sp. NPDC055910 TaxID=3345659 RepID=UPI0035D5E34B